MMKMLRMYFVEANFLASPETLIKRAILLVPSLSSSGKTKIVSPLIVIERPENVITLTT
jgi:hypothetical protein